MSEKEATDGRTHYEGCWRVRRHHDCAIIHIAEQQATIEAWEREAARSDATIEALHDALVKSERARRGLEGVADHYLLSTSFDTREAVEEADAAVAKLKAAGWVSE